MQCSLTKDVTVTQLVLFFYLRYVTIVVGKVHDIVGEFGYYDRNESVGLSFVYHFVPTPLSHLRHAAEVLHRKISRDKRERFILRKFFLLTDA